MKAVVTKSYDSNYTDSIKFTNGEVVKVGKTDAEWKGWISCTKYKGVTRWVPQKYLSISGDIGTLLKNYSAKELVVKVGDNLTLEFEESGWYWCKKEDGDSGWVPKENLNITSK